MKRSLLSVGLILAAFVAAFGLTAPTSEARFQDTKTGTGTFSFVVPDTNPPQPAKTDRMPAEKTESVEPEEASEDALSADSMSKSAPTTDPTPTPAPEPTE